MSKDKKKAKKVIEASLDDSEESSSGEGGASDPDITEDDMKSSIMSITIDYNNIEVELNLFEDLTITDAMDDEVDKAARNLQFIHSLHAEACKDLENMKIEFQVWEAEQDEREREEAIKPTENKILMAIRRNPKWAKKRMALTKQEALVAKLKGACAAFDRKCSLIQTKASNIRREA